MMPTKLPYAPSMANTLAIRHEIQRFESVHPSIYAIYDLLELIPDHLLAQEIREHVVCIEDSFVNSQEWTFSRSVPDLRIGVVGTLFSGKSSLVHRYLTGTYLQEESPEGGRFKKEVMVHNQSYQLLIRDEGNPPEIQFNSWVDAIIFVFSLENEDSFNAIYDFYEEMVKFQNVQEIPLILVGTRDNIGKGNHKKIEETKIRKLIGNLRRCSYYETCSKLGRNVDRVFEDTCQKICMFREQKSSGCKPTTPPHFVPRPYPRYSSSPTSGKDKTPAQSPGANLAQSGLLSVHNSHGNSSKMAEVSPSRRHKYTQVKIENGVLLDDLHDFIGDNNDEIEESFTPIPLRKNKRRSKLFTPKKASAQEKVCEEVGVGRCIPIKKGLLNKKSSNSFSKAWNKRYVTLCDDGKLSYHPSHQDYMDNVHGKEIPLHFVTVKVPGQGPRGMRTVPGVRTGLENKQTEAELFALKSGISMPHNDIGVVGVKNALENGTPNSLENVDASAPDEGRLRKKFRRLRGNGQDSEASELFEFRIVSLDGMMWQFEAQSAQDRYDWVEAIDRQIMSCLQGNESDKSKDGLNYPRFVEQEAVSRLKTDIAGNDKCVDCGTPGPSWASLNLGVLMCIECSGIHRNLGSHVSRVRSLDLDSWLPEHLAVMISLGNQRANIIWEAKMHPGVKKPGPGSSQEDKEKYIRAKYEHKMLVSDLPTGFSPAQALLESICKCDLPGVSLALCFTSEEDVNSAVSSEDSRTPIHVASAVGHIGIVQLLIWANCDVTRKDHNGRLSVFYARRTGALDVVELLVNAGCPQDILNTEGVKIDDDKLPKYGTI